MGSKLSHQRSGHQLVFTLLLRSPRTARFTTKRTYGKYVYAADHHQPYLAYCIDLRLSLQGCVR